MTTTIKKFLILINILLFTLGFVCSSKDLQNHSSRNVSKDSNVSGVPDKSSLQQNKEKEEIILTASDNVKISADYYYFEDKKEILQPLIILIHQFRQTKAQWPDFFIDSLINNGFKVLTYDIRGHGKSDKLMYDLTDLLIDPEKAPKDIDAIHNWTLTQKGVDTTRIGVMGTSIGGSLACYARMKQYIKTVVTVSNGKETFLKLLDIDERAMGRVFVRLSSVLMIQASDDGSHKQDGEYIMDNYLDTPKTLKVFNSSKHGKYLIEQYPEIYTLSIEWFKKYL
jgi:dienelactone hydrolase